MASTTPAFDIQEAAEIAMSTYSISIPIEGFLSGIVFLLYISYMRGTREEPLFLKVVTTVVMLAIMADFSLSIAVMRTYSLGSMKNVAISLQVLNLAVVQVCASLVIILLTQIYFGKMIYAATGSNKYCLAAAVFLICTTLGAAIGTVWALSDAVTNGSPQLHTSRGDRAIALHLVGAFSLALYDLLVSSVLFKIFFSNKRKAFFGQTKDILTTLLITTFETFCLTTACAIVAVVLTLLPLWLTGMPAWRVNMGVTAISTIISRVYAISLLYTLNRRAPLRERLISTSNPPSGGRLPNLHFDTILLENGGRSERKGACPGVQVQTDVLSVSDEMDTSTYDRKLRPPVAPSNLATKAVQPHPFQQVTLAPSVPV